MGKPSNKVSQTTNSTQTVTPWGPAGGALEDLVKQAQSAMSATPKTPIFTGPNADQTAGLNYMRDAATGLSHGASATQDLADKTVSGYYLNNNPFLDVNPHIASMIEASVNPLRKELDANVLRIGDAAKMAGAYGGDRNDILRAQALTGFNEAAMDAGSRVAFNAWEANQGRAAAAYDAERNRMMGAPSLYGVANNLMLAPGEMLGQVGDQQMNWDIAAKTSALDAPWAGLDRYATILGGLTPYATTNTNSTTVGKGPSAGGGLMGAASGALGGAASGAALGPWGALAGGVIGGLGGLFG